MSSDAPSNNTVSKTMSNLPDEGPITPATQAKPSKRAAFFHGLNKKRQEPDNPASSLPRKFSKWSGGKEKEHTADRDQSGHKKSRREKGEDEENRVGHDSDEDTDGGRGPDTPGFKVKNRYLPIISGLVCPFSVLLDIPGLTERWYVKESMGMVVDTQPNTPLLDAALGLSIAFGLLANVALIVRFLEKKPYPTTVIAIVALTIHDCINVATIVNFGIVHAVDDGFTYGIAYWMSVAATACSLTCNVTLVIDFVRIKQFSKNGSGLTEKQRSLVIAVMGLLMYMGLGSLVYTYLVLDPNSDGRLSFIDALYFTICTITSVGFGDIAPNTTGARIFSFFYDVVGLILLGFTIAIARETVIETFEASYRHRREELAAKARERKEAKRERLKARRQERDRQLREQIEAGHLPPDTKELPETHRKKVGGGRGGAGASGGERAKIERAKRELDWDAEEAHGVSAGKRWIRLMMRKYGWMKAYTPKEEDLKHKHPDNDDDDDGFSTLSRTGSTLSTASSEAKFRSFKKQLQDEQSKEFRTKLTIVSLLFVFFWFIGAGVFTATEGWAYGSSLYFCYIFFLTIGYGDFSPQSSGGRAFFIAWAIFGIANVTLLISVLTESWSSRYKSSISEGKTKRVMRRLGKRSNKSHDQSALKVLKLEGFDGTDDAIKAEDLPQKLMDAVKGFHQHARYFMFGRTGDTPEALRPLLDAADEADDELEAYARGDLAESAGTGETKHFLFMVSYERQFDILLDMAEQLNDVFHQHTKELKDMQKLNRRLKDHLAELGENIEDLSSEDEEGEEGGEQTEREEGEDGEEEEEVGHNRQDEEEEKIKEDKENCRGPFEKRPPGGFGDDKNDKKLVKELDRTSTKASSSRRSGEDAPDYGDDEDNDEEEAGDGETEARDDDKSSSSSSSSANGPFEKRPPGGPGDGKRDKDLARDIDDDDELDEAEYGPKKWKQLSEAQQYEIEQKEREGLGGSGFDNSGHPSPDNSRAASPEPVDRRASPGNDRTDSPEPIDDDDGEREDKDKPMPIAKPGLRDDKEVPEEQEVGQADSGENSVDDAARRGEFVGRAKDNPTPAGRAVRRASMLLRRAGSTSSVPSISSNTAQEARRRKDSTTTNASSPVEKTPSRVAFADEQHGRGGGGAAKAEQSGEEADTNVGAAGGGPRYGHRGTKVEPRFEKMDDDGQKEREQIEREEKRDAAEAYST